MRFKAFEVLTERDIIRIDLKAVQSYPLRRCADFAFAENYLYLKNKQYQ